jgi:iron complex transport system substrate-binding protein
MRKLVLLLLVLAASPLSAAPPRRVVSLAPSLTEMVFALGAGDRLVGVTTYCNYPAAAKRVQKVGGIVDGSLDFEHVLGLKPDLVVAIGEGQERSVDSLRRLGLRVEIVPSQTFDDVFSALTRLGVLLGREEAAKGLTAELSRRVERVRRAVATLPPEKRPRVFYELWDRPMMTASRDTLIGRLIEMAGGVNIFADVSSRYPQVSPEAVVARNPDLIVAPDHHAANVTPRALAQQPGLAGLAAVRRGRVLVINGDLVSRPGPRMADALELLARTLHPDLFPVRETP